MLDHALGMQQAVWMVAFSAVRKIVEIEQAIERGATIEPGPCRYIKGLRAVVSDEKVT